MTTPTIRAPAPRAASSGSEEIGQEPHAFSTHLANRLQRFRPVVAGGVVVMIGYLLLVGAMFGAGAFLVDVVLPGAVQRWDDDVVRFLIRGRPDLNRWSLVGSYLSEAVTVIAVFLAMIAYSLFRKWRRFAMFLVVAISLEGLLYVTTTYFVARDRPSVRRLEDLIVSDSYPSGHVAAALVLWVCVAALVFRITPNRAARGVAVLVAALAPVVVALARMYRGMHHPTDAIAGYAMGCACLLVGVVAVRTSAEVARRRREEEAAS